MRNPQYPVVQVPSIATESYAFIGDEQIGPMSMVGIRNEIARRGAEGVALVAKAGDQDWLPFSEATAFNHLR